MRFALAIAIALNFWAARGVNVPCTTVASVPGADAVMPKYRFPNTDYFVTADMTAARGDCRIMLSSQGGGLRVVNPSLYCADVVHEVGHIAGLVHRDDGVMNAELEENAIWDCAHWRTYAARHGIRLSRYALLHPREN